MKSELIENRIIVWNIEDSKKLFSQGYYGKPIGIPKPKIEEIDAPLILDLIEGLYLLENKKITITKSTFPTARRKPSNTSTTTSVPIITMSSGP